jgi:hypothetical protein
MLSSRIRIQGYLLFLPFIDTRLLKLNSSTYKQSFLELREQEPKSFALMHATKKDLHVFVTYS